MPEATIWKRHTHECLIRKGSKGCDKGYLCTYAHPKLSQASVSNRRCNRKICHFYYVSGSLRPNHHGTALEKRSDNTLEKMHSLTPLMQIKLPVPEKSSQLSTLPSNPIYPSQSTKPCVPIQYSLPPYKTQSHSSHPPSQESHPLMHNMWPTLSGQETYHPIPLSLCLPN